MRLPATAVLLLLLAAPALGQHGGRHAGGGEGGGAPLAEAGISLERAVDMVQRRFNARVVRTEQGSEGADVVYRIRLLSDDGRVFTVRVNARTGEID